MLNPQYLVTQRQKLVQAQTLHQTLHQMWMELSRDEAFVEFMKSPGKRGDLEEATFLNSTTALKPIRVRSIAKDPRAIAAAEDEHSTLVEINERSSVRKSIADLARELKS